MAVAHVPALSLRALTKRYDDGLLALDNFDLEIPAGEFFGLLGPNGAGKTTLISAICNLIRVTSGEISIFGFPHREAAARRMIGIAEQDVNLDRFIDAEEILVYQAGYYGLSRREAWRRTRELLELFDLSAKAKSRRSQLSGGMQRRLLLARALVHGPRLLILDEPTAGADVELRAELWDYIRRLHGAGTTVLLTTHYLEEAEALCDEIALLRDGAVVARGSASALRDRFGARDIGELYLRVMAA